MLKPLEVDFYNSKDFWDKPQEERYKYFKMFQLAFIGIVDFPKDEDTAKKLISAKEELLLVVFCKFAFGLIVYSYCVPSKVPELAGLLVLV